MFGGGEAGRHTLRRMNNDAESRGGGSKHTWLLFLLDISPWGCRHLLLKFIMACLYLLPQKPSNSKLRGNRNCSLDSLPPVFLSSRSLSPICISLLLSQEWTKWLLSVERDCSVLHTEQWDVLPQTKASKDEHTVPSSQLTLNAHDT